MTSKDFNQLDLNRQSHLVWVWGFYISNKKNGKFNRVLFALEDFFVEVNLHLGIDDIDNIKAFSAEEVNLADYGVVDTNNPFLKNIFPKVPEYLREVA